MLCLSCPSFWAGARHMALVYLAQGTQGDIWDISEHSRTLLVVTCQGSTGVTPGHTRTLAWLLWVGSAVTNTAPKPLQQHSTCMWWHGNKISSFAPTENAPCWHHCSNFPTSHHWGTPTLLFAVRWGCFFNQGVQQKSQTAANLHKTTAECTRPPSNPSLPHTNSRLLSLSKGTRPQWHQHGCVQRMVLSAAQILHAPKAQQCWRASCTLGGMLIWVLLLLL